MHSRNWIYNGATLFVILFVSQISFSQNLHLGIKGGFSNYQGDLQQQRLSFRQAGPALSLGLRYDFSSRIIGRCFISYATLAAADSNNRSLNLQARNLSFRTRLWEGELGVQYQIRDLNDYWWTPYLFAGVGFFNYKPYAYNNVDNKVFLQPLSTEGQGFVAGEKPYKLNQFAIPFGIGAEYALNEDMRLGLEFGYRLTFTDYLDDVSGRYVDRSVLLLSRGQEAVDMAYRGGGTYPSPGEQRGNSFNRDAYYFFQLTFIIRPFVDWYSRTSGFASFKQNKRVGCPGTRNR
jgi:hypothetical protein